MAGAMCTALWVSPGPLIVQQTPISLRGSVTAQAQNLQRFARDHLLPSAVIHGANPRVGLERLRVARPGFQLML
ncbi:hypothetical protein GCM10007231_24960 [Nocardioides daphniae]|uniref:Uncharacterized protein n=1 Tax=Nocardioides daphniae TaxID=402297 RepID=A0ABQ1QE86_9ACTN|nr:hypothetical protein GCM10007231_24960 [Nocardioides daphniae]